VEYKGVGQEVVWESPKVDIRKIVSRFGFHFFELLSGLDLKKLFD
jgi:hypothetical protein